MANTSLVYPSKLKDDINLSEGSCFVVFKPRKKIIEYPSLEDIQNSNANTTQKIVTSKTLKYIYLPIRPITDTISQNYQGFEGANYGGGLLDFLKRKGASALNAALPSELVFALKENVFGKGIDNPHEKILYAGHQRRNFSISWEFLKPDNEEDEKILWDIINVFRRNSIGNYSNLVIEPPPFWDIEFYVQTEGQPITPILIYKNCGFNSVAVTYGGNEEGFKALKSGTPLISLAMDIGEMDYPTRDGVTYGGKNNDRGKDLDILTNTKNTVS